MELKYIEIFCAVVEKRSFSRAAQALGVTQPTVSIQIKALEDELATKLFDRMGRAVVPTREGEILYRYGKEIVGLKEEARLAMEECSGGMSGTLTIGASTIPGEYILPLALARYKEAYPGVLPTLRIADSGDIGKSVLEGEVDLGIVGTVIDNGNIVSKKFLDDELVLVASGTFKQSILQKNELKEIPLLIRESGSGSRDTLLKHLVKMGIALEDCRIVAEIGSSQALIHAVQAGMGLAFLSRISVAKEVERKTLKIVELKGKKLKRNFYIITHRLRHQSLICGTFIDFLSRWRR